MNKKEIILGVSSAFIAWSLGIFSVPYLDTYLEKYFDEIGLFFVFSSITLAITSIILVVALKAILSKWLDDDHLLDYIYFTLRLILLSFFATYLLMRIHIYIVLPILLGIELYGIFLNKESTKNEKMDSYLK